MLSSLGKLGCKWAFLGEFSMIRIVCFQASKEMHCLFGISFWYLFFGMNPKNTVFMMYLRIFHYFSVHCSIAQNPFYAYNCHDAVHSCNASSNLHHTDSYQKESSHHLPYQKSFRNLTLHFRKKKPVKIALFKNKPSLLLSHISPTSSFYFPFPPVTVTLFIHVSAVASGWKPTDHQAQRWWHRKPRRWCQNHDHSNNVNEHLEFFNVGKTTG